MTERHLVLVAGGELTSRGPELRVPAELVPASTGSTEQTRRAPAGAVRTRRPRAGATTASGVTPPSTQTTSPLRSGRYARTTATRATRPASATGPTARAGRTRPARARGPRRRPARGPPLARCLTPRRSTRPARDSGRGA